MITYSASRFSTTILLSILSLTAFNSTCFANPKDTSSSVTTDQLPPPQPDISELRFSDFFQMPIGPLGPQPTEKLQQLDGKKIRITGYMAKEEEPIEGLFILSGLPVSVAEKSDGPADDLPVATLFVHMPKEDADKILAYRAGPWVLTGTLQLGNKEESNGRTSYARLLLDKKDFEKEKSKKIQKRISKN